MKVNRTLFQGRRRKQSDHIAHNLDIFGAHSRLPLTCQGHIEYSECRLTPNKTSASQNPL